MVKGAPMRGALIPLRKRSGRGWTLGIYIARRLLWMVPVLLFVIFITFFLAHVAPGSPWDREGRQLSPAVINNLNLKYGLDRPIWTQFGIYLWNVIHFDFGDSYQHTGQSVNSLILDSWPYTFKLGAIAFVVILVFGVSLGVVAALRQNSIIDYAAVGLATVGASVPNFVVGIVLIIILSNFLYKATNETFFLPTGGYPQDFVHMIMPVATLSFLPIAYLARLTRSSTLDSLRQDFVRTAWAKGLKERFVVTRHVLKNSLIPVVTTAGPLFAGLITGSVIVETIFQVPGIGRAYVTSIEARDYPMILGTTVLYAGLVALLNLVVDVAYVFIDPRVRLD
ncbi:MAG TPA: ABC transporter permease [Candidatus Dormibacteraeota bacterium]|nr:ABC transporter permease [Candidatus Dormibacteraeota bacterium]